MVSTKFSICTNKYEDLMKPNISCTGFAWNTTCISTIIYGPLTNQMCRIYVIGCVQNIGVTIILTAATLDPSRRRRRGGVSFFFAAICRVLMLPCQLIAKSRMQPHLGCSYGLRTIN